MPARTQAPSLIARVALGGFSAALGARREVPRWVAALAGGASALAATWVIVGLRGAAGRKARFLGLAAGAAEDWAVISAQRTIRRAIEEREAA